jgi:hypothetical protein
MSGQSEQSFRPKLLVAAQKFKTNIIISRCRLKNWLSFVIDSL